MLCDVTLAGIDPHPMPPLAHFFVLEIEWLEKGKSSGETNPAGLGWWLDLNNRGAIWPTNSGAQHSGARRIQSGLKGFNPDANINLAAQETLNEAPHIKVLHYLHGDCCADRRVAQGNGSSWAQAVTANGWGTLTSAHGPWNTITNSWWTLMADEWWIGEGRPCHWSMQVCQVRSSKWLQGCASANYRRG